MFGFLRTVFGGSSGKTSVRVYENISEVEWQACVHESIKDGGKAEFLSDDYRYNINHNDGIDMEGYTLWIQSTYDTNMEYYTNRAFKRTQGGKRVNVGRFISEKKYRNGKSRNCFKRGKGVVYENRKGRKTNNLWSRLGL